MNAAIDRETILRQFENWLDGALSAEEPPAGIDAEILAALTEGGESAEELERRCDSYSLWAAMTALSQEVKLQGRAFKELHETLGAQASRAADEIRAAYRERERDVQREAERKTRKEILGALIDLRDRLGRGLESVRSGERRMVEASRGRLAQIFSKRRNAAAAETVAALKKGYELGLARLDQTLEEFNAREIRCEGQPFDPRRMNAIDKQAQPGLPEGTVIEVYRSGYEWNGEIFRPAQVKVSCMPANGEAK